MKSLKLLPLLFIMFTIASCSNESIEAKEDAVEAKKESIHAKSPSPIGTPSNPLDLGGGGSTPIPIGEEEQLMYMTSYLIGRTLFEDQEARDYFDQKLEELQGDPFPLDGLLRTHAIEVNPFEVAFREQYYIYHGEPDPTGAGVIEPIQDPDPDPSRWGGILDALYNDYLEEITVVNEWELHFPNLELLTLFGDLNNYINANYPLVQLWKETGETNTFSDGVILNQWGGGDYLPFNYTITNTSFSTILMETAP